MGGKLRVTGGYDGCTRSEVMVECAFNLKNDISIGWACPMKINDKFLLLTRFLSIIQTDGAKLDLKRDGAKLETSKREDEITPSFPLGLRSCPAWQRVLIIWCLKKKM